MRWVVGGGGVRYSFGRLSVLITFVRSQVWPPKPSSTDIKGWGDDADLDGEY